MPMTETLSDFYREDEHATTASYAGSGGIAAVDVLGIFDAKYTDPLGIESAAPVFRAELALVPDIQHGDELTIAGTLYGVRKVEKNTPTHGEVMIWLSEI